MSSNGAGWINEVGFEEGNTQSALVDQEMLLNYGSYKAQ
jgi:hypothetical protein